MSERGGKFWLRLVQKRGQAQRPETLVMDEGKMGAGSVVQKKAAAQLATAAA